MAPQPNSLNKEKPRKVNESSRKSKKSALKRVARNKKSGKDVQNDKKTDRTGGAARKKASTSTKSKKVITKKPSEAHNQQDRYPLRSRGPLPDPEPADPSVVKKDEQKKVKSDNPAPINKNNTKTSERGQVNRKKDVHFGADDLGSYDSENDQEQSHKKEKKEAAKLSNDKAKKNDNAKPTPQQKKD